MLRRFLAAAVFVLFATQAHAANRLDVSECNSLAVTNGTIAQVAPEPCTDQTPVDFSGGVASSAAFGSSTSYIWVMCDTQCSFKIGTNTTAATTNKRSPSLTSMYFVVQRGYKISVIGSP